MREVLPDLEADKSEPEKLLISASPVCEHGNFEKVLPDEST
jgi:hypothetical protein